MLMVDRLKLVSSDSGNAIAVVQGSRGYTYAEIGQLTANVASYLISTGLTRGDRAAILVANSAQYIAIFYGIWAAGGVTVALNTQAKARDIANWVTHSGAKWLFADSRHPEAARVSEMLDETTRLVRVCPEGQPQEQDLDPVWQEIEQASETFCDLHIHERDLASIIYTSGTTGHPKGVSLSHGNLAANTDSILDYLKLSRSDSIVNVLPFYYSYGNSILHTHIAVGARLVLENSLLYPHRVVARISQERVSGFSGVPSTFSLILGRVELAKYDLSSLRYLTQAGGPMSPAIADRLLATLPQAELFIMYGQTEASARLSYLPSSQVKEKRGSIGIPIPGVSIEIRDKKGTIANPGVTGEICAKGPNIMQGYWRDESKTSEVIIDGWLHTGDLAHYDEDGYIYIDGRSSEMIKSGGNRISPKEVEEIILELSEVQEVAVVGISDEHLGESIKAFVVPIPGGKLDVKAVQLHCRKNLALYKIPKSVEFTDSLPKTASGKVQRYLLQNSKPQS
jgi:acyl-CoA synthetase (AMP-forming)/AMP-acid ligase II